MKNLYLSLLLSILTLGLTAQDRHFTLFDYAPLTLNPAMTGAFSGTLRVGGIFRSQQPTFNSLYNTPNIYVDVPLVRGFRKYDWVGIGFNVWSDRAGSTATLTQSKIGLSAAYHLALDRRRNQVLTLGVFGGNRSVSYANLNFNDNSEAERGTNLNALELGVGMMYRNKIDKKTFLELGLAVDNLGGDVSNIETFDFSQPTIIALHGKIDYAISDAWTLTPKAFVQTQSGGGTEMVLQGWMSRALVSKEEIQEAKRKRRTLKPNKVLMGGLGYRFGNAVQVMGGISFKNLEVLASYDITLSEQNTIDNTVGGFEIAARYILQVFKEPNVKPVLFCPRF